jgi:hypothetical protein
VDGGVNDGLSMAERIMRLYVAVVLAVGICGLGSDRASADQGRDQALAIVNRAIKAEGGADNLAKLNVYERTATGKELSANSTVDFTTKLTVSLPESFHDSIELQAMGGKGTVIQVLNGDKAWRSINGKTDALGKDETQELRSELYLRRICTLLPLKGADFQLKVLTDIKVDGKLAHVIQVDSKGHTPVKLYFDRGTGRLVGSEHRLRQGTLTVVREYRFSRYKVFDGVKLPSVQIGYTNGSKAEELHITRYRFLEKADSKLFEKP